MVRSDLWLLSADAVARMPPVVAEHQDKYVLVVLLVEQVVWEPTKLYSADPSRDEMVPSWVFGEACKRGLDIVEKRAR